MDELKKYIDLKFKKIEKRLKKLENKLSDNDINELLDNDMNNILENDTDISNKYANIIFTDGACSKKNKNNMKNGGFGIYIKDKTDIEFLSNFKLFKKCNTVEFNINIDDMSFINTNKKFSYEITNIRAEGYAILYTLIIFKYIKLDKINNKKTLLETLNKNDIYPYTEFKSKINICNKCNTNDILIVTDSEFWINVINKWSPNWYNKEIIFDKKNCDIVLYILYYYNLLLQNNINVEFKHVRGHADKKNTYLTYFELGNIEADTLAVKSKNSIDYLFHCI